jgi:hypothetical protein
VFLVKNGDGQGDWSLDSLKKKESSPVDRCCIHPISESSVESLFIRSDRISTGNFHRRPGKPVARSAVAVRAITDSLAGRFTIPSAEMIDGSSDDQVTGRPLDVVGSVRLPRTSLMLFTVMTARAAAVMGSMSSVFIPVSVSLSESVSASVSESASESVSLLPPSDAFFRCCPTKLAHPCAFQFIIFCNVSVYFLMGTFLKTGVWCQR